MKNYYTDEKNSREFIVKYIFKNEGTEKAEIVIELGSGEKLYMEDTPKNREYLKRYDEIMKEQAHKGKNKLFTLLATDIKNNGKSLKNFTILTFILLFLTIIWNIFPTFNFLIWLAAIDTASACYILIQEVIRSFKTESIISDIQKSEKFLGIYDLLTKSLKKSNVPLKGISKKAEKTIRQDQKRGTLSLNTIHNISYTDICTIENNLRNNKEEPKKMKFAPKKARS